MGSPLDVYLDFSETDPFPDPKLTQSHELAINKLAHLKSIVKGETLVGFMHKDSFMVYKYIKAQKTEDRKHKFEHHWTAIIHNDKYDDHPFKHFPWHVHDFDGDGVDELIVRRTSGFVIYSQVKDGRGLQLGMRDVIMHDAFSSPAHVFKMYVGLFWSGRPSTSTAVNALVYTGRLQMVDIKYDRSVTSSGQGFSWFDVEGLILKLSDHSIPVQYNDDEPLELAVHSSEHLRVFKFIREGDKYRAKLLVGSTELKLEDQHSGVFFANIFSSPSKDIFQMTRTEIALWRYKQSTNTYEKVASATEAWRNNVAPNEAVMKQILKSVRVREIDRPGSPGGEELMYYDLTRETSGSLGLYIIRSYVGTDESGTLRLRMQQSLDEYIGKERFNDVCFIPRGGMADTPVSFLSTNKTIKWAFIRYEGGEITTTDPAIEYVPTEPNEPDNVHSSAAASALPFWHYPAYQVKPLPSCFSLTSQSLACEDTSTQFNALSTSPLLLYLVAMFLLFFKLFRFK